MLHAKQIDVLVTKGKAKDAHEALDNLLLLGPSNTQALKLRAKLHRYEGRFLEEAQTWQKIIDIDQEDPEAIAYIQKRQIEDREFIFFSEATKDGGQRFIAYPHKMLRATFYGLVGCLSFLFLSHYGLKTGFVQSDVSVLGMFALCILGPWVYILINFFRNVRFIDVNPESFCVLTRIKNIEYKWKDVENVYLAHSFEDDDHQLDLVIVPTNKSMPMLEVDLTEDSVIKAKWHLITKIAHLYRNPLSISREEIPTVNPTSYKY